MSSPFQRLVSCLALRAMSSIIPHHPVVVAVISGNRLLLHALAVGAFIPAPLRSGNYVRSSLRTPTLHFAFIYASTSAPHGISIPFFTPYIPFLQSYPCHFPPISSGCLHSCDVLAPIKKILLVLIGNGFFFQKDSKKQIKNKYKIKIKFQKTNTTRTF